MAYEGIAALVGRFSLGDSPLSKTLYVQSRQISYHLVLVVSAFQLEYHG